MDPEVTSAEWRGRDHVTHARSRDKSRDVAKKWFLWTFGFSVLSPSFMDGLNSSRHFPRDQIKEKRMKCGLKILYDWRKPWKIPLCWCERRNHKENNFSLVVFLVTSVSCLKINRNLKTKQHFKVRNMYFHNTCFKHVKYIFLHLI